MCCFLDPGATALNPASSAHLCVPRAQSDFVVSERGERGKGGGGAVVYDLGGERPQAVMRWREGERVFSLFPSLH